MNRELEGQFQIMSQQVKELIGIYHGAASKAGVSENEFLMWYTLLVMGGEYSQQDICNLWTLPKQTINSIVTNLTKKELVFLEAVPGTRNRKIIRLSEEGKSYGKTIVSGVYQAEMSALEKMGEEDRENCITLLGNYISLLKDEFNEE